MVRPIEIPRPDIITRQSWGALEPELKDVLLLPASDVLFTYTRGEECHTRDQCINTIQLMQRRDIERGMPDIQHNFLVGGDNKVYEGRGWHFRATKDPQFMDLDEKSIDIAYIGDFKHKRPTTDMVAAATMLLKYLVEQNYVKEEFEITPLAVNKEIEWENMPKPTEEKKVLYYPLMKENPDSFSEDKDDEG